VEDTTKTTRLRGLHGVVFAALLALSLVATTASALAANADLTDGGGRLDSGRGSRDFFHGRGLMGTTWE